MSLTLLFRAIVPSPTRLRGGGRDTLMCGSCHIRNVLIGIEYQNCCQTLDVYLLFADWMGPILLKMIYIFVTYGLASL